MDDAYQLSRFVAAQQTVFEQVLAELRGCRKRSHWMWFIFPQIEGLGRSEISRRYALAGSAEAKAYLRHPILGPRLETCTELVQQCEDRSAHDIFGSPDDEKLHACLTLFAAVSPEGSVFAQALGKYFGGKPNEATVERL